MALITGFQLNTTIHAAFWIYKPDPTVDPVSKEEFIEVNSIQRISANAAVIISTISSTQVTSNVVTVNVVNASQMRNTQIVILSGLTNTTALNGQLLSVSSFTNTSFTANFVNPDYNLTAEPAGALVTDTTTRSLDIYYPQTSIATSQAPEKLVGPPAARFIYDMEELFS